jgi:hypothetical protein
MGQKRVNVLDNEPVEVYIAKVIANNTNLNSNVGYIRNLMIKYFREIIDVVLESGIFTIGIINIRVVKVDTKRVEKYRRKYYVIPMNSAAYSYTIEVFFKERHRANYYLRPESWILELLRNRLNEPNVKIKCYAKKVT